MSAATWLPGAIVLLVGLVAGWLVTRRLGGGSKRDQNTGDLKLRTADLEERRDDLLTVLREGTLKDPTEREALESAAARVMMELDATREELGRLRPRKKKADKRAPAPTARPRSFLVGFAYGA